MDDSKTKKSAMKLPHPNWKICCSKHISNHKELPTMLHHQQLAIVIVTNLDNKKECQKLELLMPLGLH
jgi:invasion protein IalB